MGMKETFFQIKNRIEQFFALRCDQCGKVIQFESLSMVSKYTDGIIEEIRYIGEDGSSCYTRSVYAVSPLGVQGGFTSERARCGECNQKSK